MAFVENRNMFVRSHAQHFVNGNSVFVCAGDRNFKSAYYCHEYAESGTALPLPPYQFITRLEGRGRYGSNENRELSEDAWSDRKRVDQHMTVTRFSGYLHRCFAATNFAQCWKRPSHNFGSENG